MSDGNGADRTARKQPVGVPFEPGQSGNPAGRPKGSRNKLGEAFLEDMLVAWSDKGKAAIESVIRERPQDFLKVVASILPKEIAAEVTHNYVARLPAPVGSMDEWQKQYSPTKPVHQ